MCEKETKMCEWEREIGKMMWSCGDGERTVEASAAFVEEEVRRELIGFMEGSREIRDGAIDLVGLLFQLRRDPPLLHRLLNFIRAKDAKALVDSSDADKELNGVSTWEAGAAGKGLSAMREALAHFDVSGELTQLSEEGSLDSLKRQRLRKALERASSLSMGEHQRLTEASQASFARSGKAARFKDWLAECFGGRGQSPRIGPLELEVLSFLAKEVVILLTETALLVKGKGRGGRGRALVAVAGSFGRGGVLKPRSRHQQTSLLLAQKIRERGGGKEILSGLGMDVVGAQQIQPQHLHEALRRIRLAHGGNFPPSILLRPLR